ncbi:hypothetical protein WK28_24040 [Burkholderia vietnamiensis]|nr:hypothetical protein WK28_24040 [Burkholderia vietnamiensis]
MPRSRAVLERIDDLVRDFLKVVRSLARSLARRSRASRRFSSGRRRSSQGLDLADCRIGNAELDSEVLEFFEGQASSRDFAFDKSDTVRTGVDWRDYALQQLIQRVGRLCLEHEVTTVSIDIDDRVQRGKHNDLAGRCRH